MDKRYLTAFLCPPKFVVGGIELDYFSPRHFITLEALESPFVLTNKVESLCYKDLFMALRVCSTKSWTEAVARPKFSERLKYYMLEGILTRQATAFAHFGFYLSESMTVPKLWTKDKDEEGKRDTNLPDTMAIVTLLITKFGFSEEEAWNMPFSKAIWYATAYAMQEGGEISIISTEQEDTEQDKLKELKEFEKKIMESLSSVSAKRKVNVL